MSSNSTANPSPPAEPSSAPSSPAQSNPPSAEPTPSAAPPPSSPSPSPSPSPAPEPSTPVNSPSPSNPAPAPSSNTPAPAPSSQQQPAPSSAPAPAPSSQANRPPPSSVVQTTTAPSPSPTETEVDEITVTQTPTRAGESPIVIVVTSYRNRPGSPSQPTDGATNSNVADPSTTDPSLQGARKENAGGLSTGGKTAIAVVIPVVVVALLVLGALFFWRKRKQRKNNEDERRKEVEEYGFNPNHDPTLPAVGMTTEMAEDSSGYRGWGNTTTSSGRKASTTLTSGMTYSDSNSNPGGYHSPNSPTNAYSDANSNEPLTNGRRETLDSDGIAALGAGPAATRDQNGINRGPSNASSSYSAANHSDNSGDYPGMAMGHPQEYQYEPGYGSYNEGPYTGNNAYGGAGQQPVIRDVSARRNTRIENPSVFPQQGNSGVATNF